MDDVYYDMIFKRKSFHMFKEIIPLSKVELEEIQEQITMLTPLCNEIKVSFKIVPKSETTCKRGEYCILIYSELKNNFLQNIGYLGQQLDLWLASKNIGACWYGLGKALESQYKGLDFIIMLSIGKTKSEYFRKDYRKCSRRPLLDISDAQEYTANILNVARYAPSACNSQPWFVEYSDNSVNLYRTCGKKGLMPMDKMTVINRIDIGIMMLFIELYFAQNHIAFERQLFIDFPNENERALQVNQRVLNAIYNITP